MDNEKLVLLIIIGLVIWQVSLMGPLMGQGEQKITKPMLSIRLYDKDMNLITANKPLAVVGGVPNVQYLSLVTTIINVGNFELFDAGVISGSPNDVKVAYQQKPKYHLHNNEFAEIESGLINVDDYINTSTLFSVNVSANYVDLDSKTKSVWKIASVIIKIDPDPFSVNVSGGSNSSIGPHENGVICNSSSECYSGHCQSYRQYTPYLVSNFSTTNCPFSCPAGYNFCVKRFGDITGCVAGGTTGSSTGSSVARYCTVEGFSYDSYQEVDLYTPGHGYYSWGPCSTAYDFCLVYDTADKSICVDLNGYLKPGQSFNGGWISGVHGYKYSKVKICGDGASCIKAGDACAMDNECCSGRCYSMFEGEVLYHRCA